MGRGVLGKRQRGDGLESESEDYDSDDDEAIFRSLSQEMSKSKGQPGL